MSRWQLSHFVVILSLVLLMLTNQTLSNYIAPITCPISYTPPSDSFKYCGRISITELETNFIYSQASSTDLQQSNCLSIAPSNFTIDQETIIGNPLFAIGKYFNTTWCSARWKNTTFTFVTTTRRELCATNQDAKIFYIISDSYNVDKSKGFILVDDIINENYFTNYTMSLPTAYDDSVFIVKGPNFALTTWKYGMVGTVSNQHPKLLLDSSFQFQITSVGSGDKNGPGVTLKNIYSNDCLTAVIDPFTSNIKLRMQTCSGVTTLKKAAQKGDDIAAIYSKQKFFWTGKLLFSSIIANTNLGQLEAMAVTSSVFGSPTFKWKGVQFLTMYSLNESAIEKFYATSCLYDQDTTLQNQLADNDLVRFSSALLLNHSSRGCSIHNGLLLVLLLLIGLIIG